MASVPPALEPAVYSLPDIELLESTHIFPGSFTFKAIGWESDHFMGRVVAAVRSELSDDAEPQFSFRKTASGRHICVTIAPRSSRPSTCSASTSSSWRWTAS